MAVMFVSKGTLDNSEDDMTEIDYKQLLEKYMRHVGEQEGSYFLPEETSFYCTCRFTPEEVKELDRVSYTASKEVAT